MLQQLIGTLLQEIRVLSQFLHLVYKYLVFIGLTNVGFVPFVVGSSLDQDQSLSQVLNPRECLETFVGQRHQ